MSSGIFVLVGFAALRTVEVGLVEQLKYKLVDAISFVVSSAVRTFLFIFQAVINALVAVQFATL